MSTEPEVAKLVSMSAIDELLGEIEERNASVMERIRDAEMKLGIKEKIAVKKALDFIKNTDVEKLLKEYHVIE